MELLFVDGQTNDGQFIVNEISEIMLTDLRTVIQTTIAMDRENVIVVSEFWKICFSHKYSSNITFLGSFSGCNDRNISSNEIVSLRAVHKRV